QELGGLLELDRAALEQHAQIVVPKTRRELRREQLPVRAPEQLVGRALRQPLELRIHEHVAALRVLREHRRGGVVEHLAQPRLALAKLAQAVARLRIGRQFRAAHTVRVLTASLRASIDSTARLPPDCYTSEADRYKRETIEARGLLRRRHEHVTDAADRADRGGVVGIRLHLAPQARDPNVDRAVERLPLAVLRELEYPVARQRLAR